MPETHGSHWDCICPTEEEFSRQMAQALSSSTSEAVANIPWPHFAKIPDDWTGDRLIALLQTTGHVRFMVVLLADTKDRHSTVYTAYPYVCSGTELELIIKSINPWRNGLEGSVTGSVDDQQDIVFFDPWFFATRERYRVGETARVRLAAMSYGVRPVERLYFEIPEGESADILRAGLTNSPEGPVKISVQGMVGRFPIEEWGMDEYSFMSPVKGCRTFTENDRNFVEIEIGLHRNADGEAPDIDVPLLVLEQLIEGTETLSQDDMIEGRYWLQGTLVDDNAH